MTTQTDLSSSSLTFSFLFCFAFSYFDLYIYIYIYKDIVVSFDFGQQSDLEGLSGSLKFGEDGRRENFTLSVVEMTINSDIVKVRQRQYVTLRPFGVWSRKNGDIFSLSLSLFPQQIGQWSEQSRFQTVPAKYVRLPATPEFEKNRTYIVTTYMVRNHHSINYNLKISD